MSRFLDHWAAHYADPGAAVAAFLPDAVVAAASVGALLESAPELDGRRHYLPSLAGKRDRKQFALGSIEQHKDGTSWPAITFKSFKGATTYWTPRDAAFREWLATRGAPVAANDDGRSAARDAAAAAVDAARAKAAEHDRQQAVGREAAAAVAASVWASADPADDAHAYLQRKGVRSHGLRVASQDVHARLWSDADATWRSVAAVRAGDLLIPLFDEAGRLVSLQRIDATGKKRFVMGGRAQGCHFFISGTSGRTVLAEGYATAATWHEATGDAVAVAFNAGNLPAVAAYVKPDAIAADNDNAPKADENFARALGSYGTGHKAAMSTGLPFYMPHAPGQDWNDAGHQAAAQAAAAAPTSATPVLDPWRLERRDVTGEARKQLFQKLGQVQNAQEAAELALAVALRLFLGAPVQDSVAGIRASIEAALPAGACHPATLDGIAERLDAAMAYRKAAALAHVSIPAHALKRHRVERFTRLPALGPADYHGVIVLHAPMASGKTREVGAPFVAWAKAQGLMPLALCHRVSLVNDMAGALGLVNYADIEAGTAWDPSIDGVAVCLPSITSRTYALLVDAAEVVFMDEVSQVLRFLAAADHCRTKDGTNEAVYRRLRELVSKARCVMVADAGCDERTIAFLEACRPGESFRVLEVAHKPEGIAATYSYGMHAPATVVGQCLEELAAGGRVWIATESARRAKVLGAFFETQGHRVMAVHSDNKGNKAQAAFLSDPEAESLRYDVVIASPVIGSGLSISHRDAGPWFTLGAFIGGGHRVPPADAAQALRRVRYLRRYVLGLIPNSVTGKQSAKSIELAWTEAAQLEGAAALPDDFTELVAGIQASDANARADFASGLLWQLEAAKWSLRRGVCEDEDAAAGLKVLKDQQEAEHLAALKAAPLIHDFEAERLRSKPARTEAENIALEAWRIRTSLGVPELDDEALEVWDGGAVVAKLDRFSAWRGVVAKYDDSGENLARRRFRRAAARAYAEVFRGLALADARISEDVAAQVLDRIIAMRHLLAHLTIVPKTYGTWSEDKGGELLEFKRPKNARQELAEVLRRMGLEWKAVTVRLARTPALIPLEDMEQGACKPKAKNGRVYVVTAESLTRMDTWSARRNSRRSVITVAEQQSEDVAFWHGLRLNLWQQADRITVQHAVGTVVHALKARRLTHEAKVTAFWVRHVLADRMAA